MVNTRSGSSSRNTFSGNAKSKTGNQSKASQQIVKPDKRVLKDVIVKERTPVAKAEQTLIKATGAKEPPTLPKGKGADFMVLNNNVIVPE